MGSSVVQPMGSDVAAWLRACGIHPVHVAAKGPSLIAARSIAVIVSLLPSSFIPLSAVEVQSELQKT